MGTRIYKPVRAGNGKRVSFGNVSQHRQTETRIDEQIKASTMTTSMTTTVTTTTTTKMVSCHITSYHVRGSAAGFAGLPGRSVNQHLVTTTFPNGSKRFHVTSYHIMSGERSRLRRPAGTQFSAVLRSNFDAMVVHLGTLLKPLEAPWVPLWSHGALHGSPGGPLGALWGATGSRVK